MEVRIEIEFYPDHGCRYSSSCLRCPLTSCVEDSPATRREFRQAQQLEKAREVIREMDKRGLTVAQAAKRVGCSPRTIFRMQALVRAMDARRVA